MITNVSLWVEAYACPDDGSALPDCAKFTAFEQSVPMKTSPKSSGWFSQGVSGGLPEHIPGMALRIVRKVQSVDDAPVEGDEPQVPGEVIRDLPTDAPP